MALLQSLSWRAQEYSYGVKCYEQNHSSHRYTKFTLYPRVVTVGQMNSVLTCVMSHVSSTMLYLRYQYLKLNNYKSK